MNGLVGQRLHIILSSSSPQSRVYLAQDEPHMVKLSRQDTVRSRSVRRPRRANRYVLHDRDTKFCASFRTILATGNVKCLALPPRSPNLNAFAERWVRSVKQECVSRLILFGEGSLRRALTEFQEHYHRERNHQGKGNVLLFPSTDTRHADGGSMVQRRQRLGGLLNYYCRAA